MPIFRRHIRMQLSEQQRERLAARVAILESKTGAQVVTALVARSDAYPEAPWKAFALGAAVAALGVVIQALVLPPWDAADAMLYGVATILGTGVLLAAASVACAPLGRAFTERLRRGAEVAQYARALFVDRGLARTRGRIGVLLLVSAFEREVVLLADDGFDGKIDDEDWQELTGRVTLLLRHDGVAAALHAGLDALEALLLARGFHGQGGPNELPDAVLVMGGRA